VLWGLVLRSDGVINDLVIVPLDNRTMGGVKYPGSGVGFIPKRGFDGGIVRHRGIAEICISGDFNPADPDTFAWVVGDFLHG
jgi:hypothetical protein